MTLSEIRNAVKQSAPEDFSSLTAWIAEYENEDWDRQIREDYKSGRLDNLISSALDNIEKCNVKAISQKVFGKEENHDRNNCRT